ncbi:MAG TPA: hypothetical protein VKG44_03815, partial [Candidatus Baltobacteraceae bacterium]|nr:hypothetical protein [Candidatus Baltobacteraceae bacterium]
MLRGTPSGLQIVFDGRPFGEVAEELWSRFAERADFYRGSSATVIFQESAPAQGEFERFLERTRSYGVAITGLGGIGDAEGLARDCALPFLGAPALGRLTEQARSLDADFAGARGDLARRRARRARA